MTVGYKDLTAIKESEKLPKTVREFGNFTLFGACFLVLKKEKDRKNYQEMKEKYKEGLEKLLREAPEASGGDEKFSRILRQFEAILGRNKGQIKFDQNSIRLGLPGNYDELLQELDFLELGRVKFEYQNRFKYNFWFVLEAVKRAGKGVWSLVSNKKGYLYLYRDKELVGVVLPIVEVAEKVEE